MGNHYGVVIWKVPVVFPSNRNCPPAVLVSENRTPVKDRVTFPVSLNDPLTTPKGGISVKRKVGVEGIVNNPRVAFTVNAPVNRSVPAPGAVLAVKVPVVYGRGRR